MKCRLLRLRANRRGISGVVSGLFILVIAVAMIAFVHEIYQVQTQMSDWDAERVRERTEVSSVFFGGSEQYSPSSVTPDVGSPSNLEKIDNSYLQFGGSVINDVETPISNMNFTSGSIGWIFDKSVGAQQVESGYSSQIGDPAPGSAEGSIFVQMSGLTTGPYWMNWTYYFSYSQGSPSTTYFSWAKMVWDSHLALSATAYLILTSPNGTQIVISGPVDLLSLNLKSWYYETVALSSGVLTTSGTYALTLAVQSSTSDSGNPHDSGNIVVFFDDAGLSAVLWKTYSTDFYGTFNTGKDPAKLRNLQVSYAGRSTQQEDIQAYSPISAITMGNTSIIAGSSQNLATKDGTSLSLQSYANSVSNSYNPTSYSLLGQTTLQAGSIGNLGSNDGTYQSFNSYTNASNYQNFVSNALSNVDSSPGKGSHSNFTAQQYGPDLICDTLTEGNTGSRSSSFGSNISNTHTTVSANQMIGSVFTSPADAEGATVESITWYGRSTSTYSYSKAILVLASTKAILAVSDALYASSTLQEWTNTFATPPTISANTDYLLMMIFDYTTRFYLNPGSVNQGYSDTSNSYITPSNPTDATNNNNQYRIRASYTTKENYELDAEVQWTNANFNEKNTELAIYKKTNTHTLNASGGYMTVDGSPDWGSVTGTISFWIKWNTIGGRPWGQHDSMESRISGTNLVLDWGATGSLTSTTSFTAGKWYFIAIAWDENTNDLYLYVGDQSNTPTLDAHNSAWYYAVSTAGVTQNNFMAAKGGVGPVNGYGDDLRYWNTDRSLAAIQSDYNTELTGSEANLRSYFKLNNNFDDVGPANNDGSGSGSYSFQPDTPFGKSTEMIRVDLWTGSTWHNVFTDLADGWNNATVSSYVTSQNFTIRFKGDTESSDSERDTWQIDAVLLHSWTNDNIVEIELSGISNNAFWAALNWTLDSAWSVSGVSVTFRLFNYSSMQYPTNGDGYINYISGTPNTDQTYSQTTSSTPTTFRNGTGNWKINVKGVKETSDQFTFLCDFVQFKPNFNSYTTDWYSEYLISEFNPADTFNISYWVTFNTSAVTQKLYMYNWNTSSYDQVGSDQIYSTAGIGQWHNCTINSNLANYMSSSQVRIRVFSGEQLSNLFVAYADFQSLEVSGTAPISSSTQSIYIKDYANDRWQLLTNSTTSTSDEMIGPISISENINNYVNEQGTVLLRVSSSSDSLIDCQANFMRLRIYFIDPSKITLEVTNIGSETVNLVRVWVENATGHTRIDLVPGVNIDRATISPGETALLQVNYQVSTCQYIFKVATKRGTIAAYVKTSS